MVTEIRKRASNKSTEQASVDIANFLAPSNDTTSRGWILLNCLSLLAAGDPVRFNLWMLLYVNIALKTIFFKWSWSLLSHWPTAGITYYETCKYLLIFSRIDHDLHNVKNWMCDKKLSILYELIHLHMIPTLTGVSDRTGIVAFILVLAMIYWQKFLKKMLKLLLVHLLPVFIKQVLILVFFIN